MNHWKQFKPKACSVHLKASSKEEALAEVVENMVLAEVLSRDLAKEAEGALLERERTASTGVGMNVAIPHVKLTGIDRAICTLSIHREGIPWDAVDGAPVQLLFTVIRPNKKSVQHDPDKHLEMMRWIARLGRDADFRRFAIRVKTKTELVDLLKEMSAV
jgi:mannitol/fructose-specific phosphotransferase system IIA component (Ntr-type)